MGTDDMTDSNENEFIHYHKGGSIWAKGKMFGSELHGYGNGTGKIV
jgi:hypothetical protein